MRAVNLLPSEQRSAPKAAKAEKAPAAPPSGGSFGAFMVLGALAFAVVAVTMYVLASNTVKDRKAELARVSAEAQTVRTEAAKLKPYHDFQLMAAQRLQTVTDLANSRFDWERALGDMSRSLPADVHLKSMRGSIASDAGGGNPLRGSVQAPAIELTGCTESQSLVARMMGRLRAVRGVTRVSLAKSDKGVEAPGTAAGAAAGPEGSLCKGTSPAAFEVVVFFERSVVAAGALPNAAAPAAAGVQPGSTPAHPGSAAQPGQQPAQPAQPGTSPAQPDTTVPAQPGTTTPAQPGTGSTTQGVSAP